MVKDALIPDPSLEVADRFRGAVLLLVIGHRFSKLKRFLSGFSGSGGITSLKACVHLQGSPKGDAKVQEHLEDPAKVLSLLHQVLRLGIGAAGRIVKNFPEKK